jgi:membrane protease subunit (stomatin/prohibitin family)
MKRPPRIVRAPDRATASVLVRVPETGATRLRLGMSCVVGEGQVAAFERGGLTLDVLEAGRHTLSPRTVPNLARLDPRRRTAVEAAVYFVSRRVFTNWSWATREPLRITGRDGQVALRAEGIYTFRVVDPKPFLEREVEPRGARDEEDVREGLNEVILSRLGRILEKRLSRGRTPTGLRGELATHLRLDLQEAFARRGIELIDFFVAELTVVSKGKASPPSGEEREGSPLLPSRGPVSSSPDLYSAEGRSGRPACPHCGSSWEVGGACRACQAEIPAGARFCPACGSSQLRRDRA